MIPEGNAGRVAPPQPVRARALWDPFGFLPQPEGVREGPNG